MVDAMAPDVALQAFWAWDEATEENLWFSRVVFKQWGCAERFIETAGRWIPF